MGSEHAEGVQWQQRQKVLTKTTEDCHLITVRVTLEKIKRGWNDGSVFRASAALAEDLDSIPAPTQNSQLSLATPAPEPSPQVQSTTGTHTEISLQKRKFALGTYCKE